jgi:FlaA1/EpsC-like NDP-sugar epimerase
MVKAVISLTRNQKQLILLLVDVVCVPIALLFAFAVLFSTSRPHLALLLNWPMVPLLAVAASALSMMLGQHKVRLKEYDLKAAIATALFAGLLSIVSAALAALGGLKIPLGFHIIFGLVFFFSAAGARILLLQALLAIYRRSDVITRVLIYGAGRTGMTLASKLKQTSDIVPVAFLDDNSTLRGLTVLGLPVYSGVQIERVLARYRVDRVILAMPSLSVDKQSYLSRRLERLNLDVQTLPAFAQLLGDEDLTEKLLPTSDGTFLSRAQFRDQLDCGRAEFAGKSVLITGAGGSIGLELCRQVLAFAPKRLVIFEIGELQLYGADMELRLLTENSNTEIVSVLGSVTDKMAVEQAIRRNSVEIVLHAAAYKHVPIVEENWRAGLINNTFGTSVVAQTARDCGVDRFVLISTDKAVRPANVMGASKRLAELVVQDLANRSDKTIFSIVRFGNVLGSSGSVIPLFQNQIARGGPVTLTDDSVTRYFMTIHEAARLVLVAGSLAQGGEVFVLDMGQPVKIRDLARQLIEASGYTVKNADNPNGDIEIVTTGLRQGEKLHEELMIRTGALLTAHPKIISVFEDCLSEIELAAAMRDLNDALDNENLDAIQSVLVRWIPEYRPKDNVIQTPVRLNVAERLS